MSFGDIPKLPTLSKQVSKLISRQEIKTGPGRKGRGGGEEGIRKEERGRGRKREKRGIGLPSKAKAASTTPAQTPGSGADAFRSRQAKFPAAPYIIPIQYYNTHRKKKVAKNQQCISHPLSNKGRGYTHTIIRSGYEPSTRLSNSDTS